MAAVLLAAGCGGEELPSRAGTIETSQDGDGAFAPEQGAGSDEGAGTGDGVSGETGSRSSDRLDRAGRLLSKAEARAALPAVSSMPAGWSVDPENSLAGEDEDDSDDVVKPDRCQVVFDAMTELDEDPRVQAGVTFTGGMLGPFLGVQVSSYPSEVPEERFGTWLDAMGECPRFTVDDGETVSQFTVSPLSFPNFGSESAALRLTTRVEGMGLTLDLVAIRVGHNVVTVSQAALGGPGKVRPLVRAARSTMTALAH